VLFINYLGKKISGGAKCGFCPGGALGAEIPIKGIDCGVQNQVAI